MKILLCSIPEGSLEEKEQSLIPLGNNPRDPLIPYGPLRILSWMEKKGYSADIYDISNLRHSDDELIKNFKQTQPNVVGLSATLSHCYPNVKRISKILRELFPDIWIVVGGHLTGSANVLLRKTETDICVVGDGEIPFVKLLDYFKLHPTCRQLDHTGLHQIKGLAFIDENNKIKVTGNAEQLPASEMEYTDYNKLIPGLQKYAGNGELIHDYFPSIKTEDITKWRQSTFGEQAYPEEIKFYQKYKNKKFAGIFSSRGCVARCTFCQRARKGYVTYETNRLETHLIELKEKYNVRGIEILDENFGSNREQSYEVARIMKKHDIFWSAAGIRCKSVTYEDLKFYKENNLYNIAFGIESGSQKILDIMEKKFTTEDVYNAISNCKKTGIGVDPSGMLIGMPGETKETIIKTAQSAASLRFLVEMDWNVAIPLLAMSIPGTPLYEYSQQIGVIGKTLDEEENYLIRVSNTGGNRSVLNYVNKTNSSIKEVHYWIYLFIYAAKKEYVNLIIKNNKPIKHKLLQIYKQCIKSVFNNVVFEFNNRKHYYKNKKLLQKIKWYTFISTNFLLSLSVLFLPKAVLFSIIRMYANMRFYYLCKMYKAKKGKQKYNFFSDQTIESASDFRFTDDRVAKTNRQIDRSLRSVVMENRRQMKPAITDEEIGMQILAKGQ